MANELYDAMPTFAGSFSIADTTLVFSTGDGQDPGLGQLVQTLTVMYARPVQRHWEIGTGNVYFVIGRAQGQAGVQRLAAPNAIAVQFLITFSSACNIANRTITFGQNNASCGKGGAAASYTMTSVLIDSLSMAISVGAVAITQSVSMQFIGLHIAQTGGSGTTANANIGQALQPATA